MEKIDNNIQLAFLGGMKAGLEALIHGLEVVAENNNGQVSFEFVKMVSASTIADVELKLSNMKNGKGLIDALNSERKLRIKYENYIAIFHDRMIEVKADSKKDAYNKAKRYFESREHRELFDGELKVCQIPSMISILDE